MAKATKEQMYIAKRDMTLAGRKVHKGELIRPTGALNDYRIYGEDNHWTHRWDSGEGCLCDTDGCPARFDCEANLSRHRLAVHAPERDARERARIEAAKDAAEREMGADGVVVPGETTIGGHVIKEIKEGPRGGVPYLSMRG